MKPTKKPSEISKAEEKRIVDLIPDVNESEVVRICLG